jgi:hypothetical protein
MLFELFSNLQIAYVGMDELLPRRYMTSKQKYWAVNHWICDGSDQTDYFGPGYYTCRHHNSTFICHDRAMALKLRDILRGRASREGRKAISIVTECVRVHELAERLINGANIYLPVEPDDAKRRDERDAAAGVVQYSHHLVKID